MKPPRAETATCFALLMIAALQKHLLYAACGAACVPEVQLTPSIDRPFVYIHQRKTGGTSIRHAAQAGAEHLNINSTAFIVCEQGVHCGTFRPPPTQHSFSIYAGHFNWYTVVPGKDDFACLTSFRHPLQRAVSCLYFRFPDKLRGSPLRNMSREEFRGLLLDSYHEGNSSCNNEAVLMMSRFADARSFEALMTNTNAANKVVQEAIANVKQCVVLVHGGGEGPSPDDNTEFCDWNARMLKHFFPWLPGVGRKMVNPHSQLPAHLISVVYELNWPEVLVYQAALRQFRAQQRVLSSAHTSPRRQPLCV